MYMINDGYDGSPAYSFLAKTAPQHLWGGTWRLGPTILDKNPKRLNARFGTCMARCISPRGMPPLVLLSEIEKLEEKGGLLCHDNFRPAASSSDLDKSGRGNNENRWKSTIFQYYYYHG